MNIETYDINFNKLAVWLMSKPLRKEKYLIMVKSFLHPFISLLTMFFTYRKAKLYQLYITPQVCYLEKMLNDKYDSSLKRIDIDDAVWHLPLFIYQEAEVKPVANYQEAENNPVTLFTEGECGENDFIVLVPMAISFPEPEMRSLLDQYKLFGTNYSIQRI
jgi:hypothetical protein